MRKTAGAALLIFALLAESVLGQASAPEPGTRSSSYSSYTEGDLLALALLVMMESARSNAEDLRAIMEEIAAQNRDRAKQIEATGSRYFVDDALARFSRRLGGSATARDLVEALLVVTVEPTKAGDARLKAAAAAASDADFQLASNIIDEWLESIQTTPGAEEARKGVSKLISNGGRAVELAAVGHGAAPGGYSEDDLLALVMIVLIEDSRNRGKDLRDLMAQLAALNRERAKLIELRGSSYFVEEALAQYTRHIGGSANVRTLVEALLASILDPNGDGVPQLKPAVAAASDAELKLAVGIIEDWTAGIHATLRGQEGGKSGLSTLTSNASRAIRFAEGLLAEGMAGPDATTLAGGGSGTTSSSGSGAGGSTSGGSTSGGSANFDTSCC